MIDKQQSAATLWRCYRPVLQSAILASERAARHANSFPPQPIDLLFSLSVEVLSNRELEARKHATQ